MMLSDLLIMKAVENGEIEVDPWDHHLVQPASLDIRLGWSFMHYAHTHVGVLDPQASEQPCEEFSPSEDVYALRPNQFLLGCTLERVRIGAQFAARIEGKSTLARLGLIVHSTAGFIDPGFNGNLTLEMTNINEYPVLLRPGMKIAQLSFIRMAEAPLHLYGELIGSHYQDQIGVTGPAPLPPS